MIYDPNSGTLIMTDEDKSMKEQMRTQMRNQFRGSGSHMGQEVGFREAYREGYREGYEQAMRDAHEDGMNLEKMSPAEREAYPAADFALSDQYGQTRRLSDYRGKVVFLNFWATWCPPCRAEMPDIQKLYEEYQKEEDPDVVILGVAFPDYGDEESIEGITEFLEDNGYTYPTLMDEEGSLILPYYITAYPTTYMINSDGNVVGYVPGSMTEDIMRDIIEQTVK